MFLMEESKSESNTFSRNYAVLFGFFASCPIPTLGDVITFFKLCKSICS